jgi:hypothetical protein
MAAQLASIDMLKNIDDDAHATVTQFGGEPAERQECFEFWSDYCSVPFFTTDGKIQAE